MQSFIRNAVNGAEGAGASVDRLFPVQGLMNFDPFVYNSDVIIRDYIISDNEMLLDIAENCFKYSRFHLRDKKSTRG